VKRFDKKEKLLNKFIFGIYKRKMSDEDVCYTTDQVKKVRTLCIIAIVVWIVLYIILGIFRLPDPYYIFKILLIIPIIILIIAYINAPKLSASVENVIIKFNYISVGLVVIFPLFQWIYANHTCGKPTKAIYLKVLLTGVAFSFISMYDLWFPKSGMIIFKHLKSIAQTFAITLILIALYAYYIISSSI
jgi:hypothetical protein